MLDLKKIEAKFDKLFEQETEESFNEWLLDKQIREAVTSIINHKELFVDLGMQVTQSRINCLAINSTDPSIGFTQYAMAA